MTDFAKVQAYAIKSAVIALAFADVTSYLVMKRTINAPVVASEELVDSIDHANPVRIHLEFAGLAGEASPAPSLAANDVTSQSVLPPLPAADADAKLTLVKEDPLDEPDRAGPVAAERPARRATASPRLAARYRDRKVTFSRAFAGYPLAREGSAGSTCADDAAVAANSDCPHDLAPDNAANLQSAAGPGNELPAVVGGAANLDDESRTGSTPDPQEWERGAAEQNETPPADVLLPHGPQGQDLGPKQPTALPTAADVQANAPLVAADPVVLNLIGGAPLARAADRTRTPASMSRAEHPEALAVGPRQPLAGTGGVEHRTTRSEQLAVAPPRIPEIFLPQVSLAAERSERVPMGVVLAASTQLPDRDPAPIAAALRSDGMVCLQDILVALRPLMDSDEFERLMRSKHSATVLSLTNLRAAGIAVAYDRESGQPNFT